MTVTLYLAPAAAGKTATPRVVVPTRLQARAWRRLAALWVCRYPPSTICGARFCR